MLTFLRSAPSAAGHTSLQYQCATRSHTMPAPPHTHTRSMQHSLIAHTHRAASVSPRPRPQRQEDIFYTQMTVRETLMFAARMRLPRSMPLSEKKALVDDLLQKLSLVKSADTIVGDAKRRGISGGERKRLSIGCELLSSPSLLFLDEPTSGLDAFQAQQVSPPPAPTPPPIPPPPPPSALPPMRPSPLPSPSLPPARRSSARSSASPTRAARL